LFYAFFMNNLNHSWFSASDLSSLPRTHILAIVDWAVFANVSTFDEFPPPAVGKVRDLYQYQCYCGPVWHAHWFQVVTSGSRLTTNGLEVLGIVSLISIFCSIW
jgi:hypothetical protein